MSSQKIEAESILATAQPYLDVSNRELSRLLDEALDEVEYGGLPHRGIDDRSFWRAALERLKKETAKQEFAATSTAGAVAVQAVEWAHDNGLDLTDYNIPISILVAMVVKSIWDQMNSGDDGGPGDPERPRS